MKVKELSLNYNPPVKDKIIVNKNLIYLQAKLQENKKNSRNRNVVSNLQTTVGTNTNADSSSLNMNFKYVGDFKDNFGIAIKVLRLKINESNNKKSNGISGIRKKLFSSNIPPFKIMQTDYSVPSIHKTSYSLFKSKRPKLANKDSDMGKLLTVTDYHVDLAKINKSSIQSGNVNKHTIHNETRSDFFKLQKLNIKYRPYEEQFEQIITKSKRFFKIKLTPEKSKISSAKIGVSNHPPEIQSHFQNTFIKSRLEYETINSTTLNSLSSSKIPISVKNIFSKREIKSQSEMLNPFRYDKRFITADDLFKDIDNSSVNSSQNFEPEFIPNKCVFKSRKNFFIEEKKNFKLLKRKGFEQQNVKVNKELPITLRDCIKVKSIPTD